MVEKLVLEKGSDGNAIVKGVQYVKDDKTETVAATAAGAVWDWQSRHSLSVWHRNSNREPLCWRKLARPPSERPLLRS